MVKLSGVQKKLVGSIHAASRLKKKMSFLMRRFMKIRMVFGRSLFSESDHEIHRY